MKTKHHIIEKSKIFRTSISIDVDIKTDDSQTDQPKYKAQVKIQSIQFFFHEDHIIYFLLIKMELDKVNK